MCGASYDFRNDINASRKSTILGDIISVIIFGFLIFIIPLLPLVISGIWFPVLWSSKGRNVYLSFIPILSAILLGYAVLPALLGVKDILIIADTINFPERVTLALQIGIVAAGIPYLIMATIIMIFRHVSH